ncbi:MAG: hypothetical protein ACYTGW_20245 [Planctomycetota bacterium]|jgi:hypothetical protein
MNQPPTIWRLVLWPPLAVTWAVLLIRLGGELIEGPAWLFCRDAGGGAAVVGISWLVVVFGAYFGWRLAKEGRGPNRPGGVLLVHVVANAVAIGGMFGLGAAGIIDFEKPGPAIAYGFAAVCGGASLLMLWAWPALFLANLTYGFLARLGVIAVTIPATLYSWDTHFSKLGERGMQEATWGHVMKLSMAQICFWIPFTILVAGLFGALAAMFAGGPPAVSAQPDQAGAGGVVGGGDI